MAEHASKVFYAALLLFVLVLLGAGLAEAGGEGVAFGLFAAMTIGGGLVCVWERSVVRSAFALMATFTGVAGFFVLLNADFLAMAQILIYVGAILVLLLFGVMLTPPDLGERRLPRVLGALAAVGATFGWVGMQVAGALRTRPFPELTAEVDNGDRIGFGFLRYDGYVVAFELAAVVLTVALVAAVYIARRGKVDVRRAPGIGGMGAREGDAL